MTISYYGWECFFLRHNFPHIQQYLFHLQIIFPFPIIVRVSSSGRRFCSKIKGKTEDSFYCWFRQLPHGIIHRLFSFTYQNQILYTRYISSAYLAQLITFEKKSPKSSILVHEYVSNTYCCECSFQKLLSQTSDSIPKTVSLHLMLVSAFVVS